MAMSATILRGKNNSNSTRMAQSWGSSNVFKKTAQPERVNVASVAVMDASQPP